jgi:hypothetical protein
MNHHALKMPWVVMGPARQAPRLAKLEINGLHGEFLERIPS